MFTASSHVSPTARSKYPSPSRSALATEPIAAVVAPGGRSMSWSNAQVLVATARQASGRAVEHIDSGSRVIEGHADRQIGWPSPSKSPDASCVRTRPRAVDRQPWLCALRPNLVATGRQTRRRAIEHVDRTDVVVLPRDADGKVRVAVAIEVGGSRWGPAETGPGMPGIQTAARATSNTSGRRDRPCPMESPQSVSAAARRGLPG